ncbi:MAG TPA: hypothetical protein GXZ21_12950 [Clostridiales bacterium]|nr:hypothetical protein [Clostridiales bacterium]
MLKRINSIFFGLIFLTALILEIYVIYKYDGDLLTVIGIGVVVLITGYIFMDTVRSQVQEAIINNRQDIEKSQKEELELIKKELKQLLDIQKASYTATKKNGYSLNSIEKLQKKTMEGQKNALNMELNYNKENTKQLIEVLKDENSKLKKQQEELKKILARLEEKNPSDTAEFANNNQQLTEEGNEQVIEPLYDDSNKSLTTDEISSLFETYGK